MMPGYVYELLDKSPAALKDQWERLWVVDRYLAATVESPKSIRETKYVYGLAVLGGVRDSSGAIHYKDEFRHDDEAHFLEYLRDEGYTFIERTKP